MSSCVAERSNTLTAAGKSIGAPRNPHLARRSTSEGPELEVISTTPRVVDLPAVNSLSARPPLAPSPPNANVTSPEKGVTPRLRGHSHKPSEPLTASTSSLGSSSRVPTPPSGRCRSQASSPAGRLLRDGSLSGRGGGPGSEGTGEHVVEEIVAENVRLRRELEVLQESVLHGMNANSARSVGGGQFRGSAIKGGRSKDGPARGGVMNQMELDALQRALDQKNQHLIAMEREVERLRREAQGQSAAVEELRHTLESAAEQLDVSKEKREALRKAAQELADKLENERQAVCAAQKCAADIESANAELERKSNQLQNRLKEESKEKSEAIIRAEEEARRKKELEEHLQKERARVAVLEADILKKQAELSKLEAEANCRLQNCSAAQRDLGQQLLVLLGFRDLVLRLCWDFWRQRIADNKVQRELDGLRDRLTDETERSKIKDVESQKATEKVTQLSAEVEALQKALVEEKRQAEEAQAAAAELQNGWEKRIEEHEVNIAEQKKNAKRADELQAELDAACKQASTLQAEVSRLQAQIQDQGCSEQLEAELRKLTEKSQAEQNALSDKLRALQQELEQKQKHLNANKKQEDLLKKQEDLVKKLQKRTEELEKRLKESEANEAVHAALNKRVGELEKQLKEKSARELQVQSEDPDKEKRIQREETLLKDIRRLEKEKEEMEKELKLLRAQASNKKEPSPRRSMTDRRLTTSLTDKTQLAQAAADTKPSPEAQAALTRLPEVERSLKAEENRSAKLQEELDATKKRIEAVSESAKSQEESEKELLKERKVAENLRQQVQEMKEDHSLSQIETRRLKEQCNTLKSDLAKASASAEQAAHNDESVKKWREAAEEAIAKVNSSLRILVTSPRIAINVGKNDFNISGAIQDDIMQIKGIVREQVLPGFQKIVAVAEEEGEQDVKTSVNHMVEQLASSLQQVVYQKIPDAEGTVSWDGFGAKLGTIKPPKVP